MMYEIVSFDLDGTLVDTAAEIADAANRTLESFGITRRPVREITDLIGDGARQLMLKLMARMYLERPALADTVRAEAVLEAFERHLGGTIGSSAVAYAGAREALVLLKRAGVRLACVTNKELRHARPVLLAARLDNLFELVVGGDSLPQKKPHSSVLRYVVETLNGDTRRAAHVGDSSIDIEAARNAGVAAWAVPYGYNAGVPIADSKPQHIFPGLMEVAEYVLAGRSGSPVSAAALSIHPLEDAVALEDATGGVAAARAANVPVIVTRSADFESATLEGAIAIGPGLGQIDGCARMEHTSQFD